MKESDALRGLVFDIQRYSVHDGPGIRTTVFLKGCPLKCLWCQNPEGQRFLPEIFFDRSRCTGCGRCVAVCPTGAIIIAEGRSQTRRHLCDGCGECARVCPNRARTVVGRWMSVDEVMCEVRKDAVFYASSGGGVTLSGGEPLAQAEFSAAILGLCRKAYLHTALETCGYAPWETVRGVLESVDLVLYDLKHMNPARHQAGTGVSNELILENARRICREFSVPLWVRVPVIPGYNDSQQNLTATALFVSRELGRCVQRVSLLPYHRLGESKFERLERSLPFSSGPPSEEQVEELAQIMRRFDLPVHIGG